MRRRYGYNWKQKKPSPSHDEMMCLVYELQIMFYQEEIRQIEKKLRARKQKVKP